jgi:hypothetical protein
MEVRGKKGQKTGTEGYSVPVLFRNRSTPQTPLFTTFLLLLEHMEQYIYKKNENIKIGGNRG